MLLRKYSDRYVYFVYVLCIVIIVLHAEHIAASHYTVAHVPKNFASVIL